MRAGLGVMALVTLVLAVLSKSALAATAATAAAAAAVATTAAAASASVATAIFAGGCFWCTESDFEKMPGVIAAQSGYTGGPVTNPSYEQVSNGGTGHTEAVRVTYDPARVSYRELVDAFWRTIDPTVKDRQFCDAGSQYRSAIFWANADEKQHAEASLTELKRTGRFREIHTQLAAASAFYPAEEYHQDYYKKNPIRYAYYRRGCGRDARLSELWGSR
jgi:peptide-methionine (S)-S-oxide reductase